MTDGNNNMYMPVAPAYGGGYGDGMFGGMGGWWLIIILAMMGWGNGFGGGFNGNCNGFLGADLQRGFDQQNVMQGITGIQNTLATGFAGVESAANNRQIADMNQYFQMQSAFQNCCCENRLATANLMTAVAQEGANTRSAAAQGDQMIMNKLCQLELDGIKQNYENRIAGMQNQIDALREANTLARTSAQFNALGDRFQTSQDLQTNALEQYLAPVARPAYIVQNPNCCQGVGYGNCGCNGYAA